MNEWVDENTGRTVQQLTQEPRGMALSYFRLARHLHDGRVLIFQPVERGAWAALDPDTGDLETIDIAGRQVRLTNDGRRLFYLRDDPAEMVVRDLASGEDALVASIPDHNGRFKEGDISEDGHTFFAVERVEHGAIRPLPSGRDAEALWRWLERPRDGDLLACDLASGQTTRLASLSGMSPIHVDPSPTDPNLVRFAHDYFDGYCQRIWTVRRDGSGLHPIRPQERGEVVTHEFWWPGGQLIGYTYLDRRQDPTVQETPWAEYAPVPTHLGLADLDGKEIFLSDPLNHYHTHIGVSPDGKWVFGEGTDGHLLVYVAPFSLDTTCVDLVPMATIHAQYRPFTAGHDVGATITADGRWVLYNDVIDGRMQVCRVRMDV